MSWLKAFKRMYTNSDVEVTPSPAYSPRVDINSKAAQCPSDVCVGGKPWNQYRKETGMKTQNGECVLFPAPLNKETLYKYLKKDVADFVNSIVQISLNRDGRKKTLQKLDELQERLEVLHKERFMDPGQRSSDLIRNLIMIPMDIEYGMLFCLDLVLDYTDDVEDMYKACVLKPVIKGDLRSAVVEVRKWILWLQKEAGKCEAT